MVVQPMMTVGPTDKPHAVFWRRLAGYAALSDEDVSVIRQSCAVPAHLTAGTELYREGERLTKSGVLLAGWACRMRLLADGRRQIFDFLMPGDPFGRLAPQHPLATTSAMTLTPASVANVGGVFDLVQEPDRVPGLASAWRAAQARQEALLFNHVVRLGRQSAYERVAHLLLELAHRLGEIGYPIGSFAPMPLTQEMIADALGLSVVHVNRTLGQLRRERLLETRASSLRIVKPEALAAIADFRAPAFDRRRA